MKNKLIICLIIGLNMAFGQKSANIDSTFTKNIEKSSNGTFIDFKKESIIDTKTIFTNYKSSIGLDSECNMIETKSEVDKYGITHIRYKQYYKNVEVENMEYILHEFDGKLIRANGVVKKGINLNVNPKLKPNNIFEMAINFYKSEQYIWDIDKKYKHPTAELKIISKDSASFLLVYKIDIYSLRPFFDNSLYFDANTGEIVKIVSNIHTGCENGTNMNTVFYGVQNSNTTYQTPVFQSNHYNLEENCRNDTWIHTQNFNGTEIEDNDNNWSGYANNSDQVIGATAHWAMRKSYDYFFDTHGRNSYDNDGGLIDNRIHSNSGGMVNAFYSRTTKQFHFGDGNHTTNNRSIVALDICVHEYTHAVTHHSSNLVYEKEPGALDESFSDIFATIVEFNQFGTNGGDYLIGEDLYTNDFFRSMSNPNIRLHPDTYQGAFWYNIVGCTTPVLDNDWCGVHTNSSVQNFCFFLLSEGGSGTNDIGNAYNVNGIGRTKSGAIFYRALTVYLTSSSNFQDSRNACIRSAEDLYGACSQEVISTANAWHAVGVGGASTDRVVSGVIASGNYYGYNSLRTSPTIATSVASGSNVNFAASNQVRLTGNFRANNGSSFRARTGNCVSSPGLRIAHYDAFIDTTIQNQYTKNLEDNDIQLYPNPANSEVTIKSNNIIEKIEISNLMGASVYKSESFTKQKNIEVSLLAKGVYFVYIHTSKKIFIKKLIIE